MLSLLVPLAAADSGGLCAGCTIVVGLLLGRSKPVPIPPVALKAICAQKLSIAGIGDGPWQCAASNSALDFVRRVTRLSRPNSY